jgi:hypothetical protein
MHPERKSRTANPELMTLSRKTARFAFPFPWRGGGKRPHFQPAMNKGAFRVRVAMVGFAP